MTYVRGTIEKKKQQNRLDASSYVLRRPSSLADLFRQASDLQHTSPSQGDLDEVTRLPTWPSLGEFAATSKMGPFVQKHC